MVVANDITVRFVLNSHPYKRKVKKRSVPIVNSTNIPLIFDYIMPPFIGVIGVPVLLQKLP